MACAWPGCRTDEHRVEEATWDKGKGTMQAYSVRFKDNYVNVADMVECRDFVIQRKL
jgi:hypothetical protein